VKLREAGHRLFLANHVVVGHIQEMIRWPGKDLQAVYQEMTEFNRDGARSRMRRGHDRRRAGVRLAR
jgi:hypothetical protein